jgi:hypothetical protein
MYFSLADTKTYNKNVLILIQDLIPENGVLLASGEKL